VAAARKSLEQAERLSRDFPEVVWFLSVLAESHAELARHLLGTGRATDAAEAEKSLRRAAEVAGAVADQGPTPRAAAGRYHFELAVLLTRRGKRGEAVGHLRKALELEPGNSAAGTNLVWLLGTGADPHFDDAAELVRLARAAVDASPERAALWAALGLAHYRAGDWPAAKSALERALELAKEHVAVWLLLAMTHDRLGDRAAARAWYDRAAAWLARHKTSEEEPRLLQAEAAKQLGIDLPH
jgi:tetratricopeptide (TPR) repeat protein